MYELLRARITEKGLSTNSVALKCGINPAVMYMAYKGKGYIFPAYRKRLAAFLEIDEQELFKDADEDERRKEND